MLEADLAARVCKSRRPPGPRNGASSGSEERCAHPEATKGFSLRGEANSVNALTFPPES
jgi:hypothetical protein